MTTELASTPEAELLLCNNKVGIAFNAGGIISGLGKNKLINGNFGVNQRVVAGAVVLAAGAYGHDRWKAGAAGCSYTFATVNNVTTITITAGSLIQVAEGLNLFSGTHTLSWTGTAQGKIGAGAYSASGVTGVVVGGVNLSVEFGVGTFALVQLETGSYPSYFEQRLFDQEFALCLRYYEKSYAYSTAPGSATSIATQIVICPLGNVTNTYTYAYLAFKARKRAAATVFTFDAAGSTGRANNDAGATYGAATCVATNTSEFGSHITNSSGATLTPSFGAAYYHYTASAEL